MADAFKDGLGKARRKCEFAWPATQGVPISIRNDRDVFWTAAAGRGLFGTVNSVTRPGKFMLLECGKDGVKFVLCSLDEIPLTQLDAFLGEFATELPGDLASRGLGGTGNRDAGFVSVDAVAEELREFPFQESHVQGPTLRRGGVEAKAITEGFVASARCQDHNIRKKGELLTVASKDGLFDSSVFCTKFNAFGAIDFDDELSVGMSEGLKHRSDLDDGLSDSEDFTWLIA